MRSRKKKGRVLDQITKMVSERDGWRGAWLRRRRSVAEEERGVPGRGNHLAARGDWGDCAAGGDWSE